MTTQIHLLKNNGVQRFFAVVGALCLHLPMNSLYAASQGKDLRSAHAEELVVTKTNAITWSFDYFNQPHCRPSFSGDGNSLAYVTVSDKRLNLEVYDLLKSQVIKRIPIESSPSRLIWSSDQSRLCGVIGDGLAKAATSQNMEVSKAPSVGECYTNGLNAYRHQDYGEALKWYRMAAENGNIKAQNMLGVMYAVGKGVTKDEFEAVKWYLLAAKAGDSAAELNLGLHYVHGQGLQKDMTEGIKWIRKAEQSGNPNAKKELQRLADC